MFQVVIMCNHWTFAFKHSIFCQTTELYSNSWGPRLWVNSFFFLLPVVLAERGGGRHSGVLIKVSFSDSFWVLSSTCKDMFALTLTLSPCVESIFTCQGTLNFMNRPTLILRQLGLAFPWVAAAPSAAVRPCRLAAAVSEAGSLAATPHLERQIKVMWM